MAALCVLRIKLHGASKLLERQRSEIIVFAVWRLFSAPGCWVVSLFAENLFVVLQLLQFIFRVVKQSRFLLDMGGSIVFLVVLDVQVSKDYVFHRVEFLLYYYLLLLFCLADAFAFLWAVMFLWFLMHVAGLRKFILIFIVVAPGVL